jgi:hypothetical protein
MTDQPGSPGPDSPVGDLQPADFQFQGDNGTEAVYQAEVNDQTAPDSPVYTLTVTLSSALREEAGPQLQDFLGAMRVAFTLLPEPVPPDEGSGIDEKFDIDSQISFELALAGFSGSGPVGVGVTVATVTGIGQAPSGIDPAGSAPQLLEFGNRVGPNVDAYWHARGSGKLTATINPTSGKGTIRNPLTTVIQGNTYKMTARQVIVRGYPPAGMDYLFYGRFNGPN